MTDSHAESSTDVEDFATRVAEVVGGAVAPAVDTVKVSVDADAWVAALTAARDELGLVFFSWLGAIEWANEVAIGDPLEDEVDERFELLCTVADLADGRRVTFSTTLPVDGATVDSLVGVYAGADWHERETAEMFGIEFRGHPNPEKLYLPEGFVGHPLRKSYRLLSREVKPWPGKVDVEGMPETDSAPDGPSTENPEA